MWTARPAEIEAALDRIDPSFLGTPVRRSAALDRRFAAELFFKDETANPIRSFKGRGSCNFVAQLDGVSGIVCGSAGNFGQGMAWAARSRGIALTVFASVNAVASKIAAMTRLGANVVQQGEDFDAAKVAAAAHAAANGLFYIEDGTNSAIAEGAGTLALEMTRSEGSFDAMITPLGNGALAAGVGSWMKHSRPAAMMVAVSASGAPAMAQSVRTGNLVTSPAVATIADGIAVRTPIASAVEAVRRVVDETLLVEDSDIAAAMALLGDELGLTVEPAGAAGFAAIVADPTRWRNMRIAIPLCGGNV